MRTAERAARTGVYLAASTDAAGVTGEYFEDCAPSDSAAAVDDERGRRLRDLSTELIGLSPDETVDGGDGNGSRDGDEEGGGTDSVSQRT